MRVGINIRKKVSFRGVQQEFSNVYHYNLDTAVTAPYAELVNEIVTAERSMHSTDVTFVQAQGWSAGGTKQQNQMQYEANLSGTGEGSNSGDVDRERALLVFWPAGVDIRGRPVYLRKFYHVCGSMAAGVTFLAAGVNQNTAVIPATPRSQIASYIDRLRSLTPIGGWRICAKSGRETNGPAELHRYLEHHQLGDMWRV